ncbi:S-adenosyl-L-methionine-dependent methyltransferase [Pseudovirgaria hyperparasitica]|uniref:S-adenosyl-L-methionine-dependent methyltransferase n=1 Tax=Pseudovirgaria hyperparasitica TaxID=470096 RepID=A0A6A6VU27_9PEZI|nr:S-adenosyl-L-methionine-dependent methyltransferase [Pseudovirgaria hyperparasitica]KAF2753296.1 S-adenosyl-L-methionine-dependent methyltransferase [Pseudovirgaria hyperparasitica]
MGIEDDNIKYFRDKVEWYDNNPKNKKVQEAVSKAFEDYHSWIGVNWITPEERLAESREVRLLDYACGTGIVTRRLGPHITHAIGIDITPEMVDAFNKKVSDAGIPLSNISAVTGNLLRDPVEPVELMQDKYFNFDIACIGLGFHHFEDPADAAKKLATRLKPGGVLLLIDLLSDDGTAFNDHDAVKSIQKHGFTESDMQKIYDNAGLSRFSFKVMDEKMVLEGKNGQNVSRTLFFARGEKLTG